MFKKAAIVHGFHEGGNRAGVQKVKTFSVVMRTVITLVFQLCVMFMDAVALGCGCTWMRLHMDVSKGVTE